MAWPCFPFEERLSRAGVHLCVVVGTSPCAAGRDVVQLWYSPALRRACAAAAGPTHFSSVANGEVLEGAEEKPVLFL